MTSQGTETVLRVGTAAAQAGVRVQTLHYYERRGLVVPGRSGAGYRVYQPADVSKVRAIKRAQALGFTLDEIGELLASGNDHASAERTIAFAQDKLAEIDAKIADLSAMRSRMASLLETCRCGGALADCELLADLADTAEKQETENV